MFGEYFDAHPLRETLEQPPLRLFPPADDRAAWEGVTPEDRADLLALADRYRDVPYPICTATQFMAFVRNGSRSAYEDPYFLRRKKLVAAVMDYCVSGRADALDDVVDGLIDRCADWTDASCGILTHCTAAYHDDGAGRHTNITYGDYFLVEALAKLLGTDPMLWTV